MAQPKTTGKKKQTNQVVLQDRAKGIRKVTPSKMTGLPGIDLFLASLGKDARAFVAEKAQTGDWAALAGMVVDLDWQAAKGAKILQKLTEGSPTEKKLGAAISRKNKQEIVNLLKTVAKSRPIFLTYLKTASQWPTVAQHIDLCLRCCFRQACVALNNLMDALTDSGTSVDCDQPRGRCFFRQFDEMWDGSPLISRWHPDWCIHEDCYLDGSKRPWAIGVRCNGSPFVAETLWFRNGLHCLKEGRYAYISLADDVLRPADTTTTPPQEGDLLRFDGAKWVPLTRPNANQVLKWDGASWQGVDLPAAGATKLDGLTDVTTGAKAPGDVLAWNSTAAQWVARQNVVAGRIFGDDAAPATITDVDISALAPATVANIRIVASGFQKTAAQVRPIFVEGTPKDSGGLKVDFVVTADNGTGYDQGHVDWSGTELHLTWVAVG